jgi:hypothetical protein
MYKYIIYCFIALNQISNRYFSLLYNYSKILNNYDGDNGYANFPENNTTKNLDIIKENYRKNLLLQILSNDRNNINKKISLLNLNKEKKYITNTKIENLFDEWKSDN